MVRQVVFSVFVLFGDDAYNGAGCKKDILIYPHFKPTMREVRGMSFYASV